MRVAKFIVWIPVLAIVTGCHRTAPQSPAYRSGRKEVRVDSTLMKAIETNQHLAEEADRALSFYAGSGFAQQELGYWTKGMAAVERTLPPDSTVRVRRTVFTLDSLLLEDVTEEVTVGKAHQIQAVADALPMLEHGQTVTLLVPWYLAYGTTGTTAVAPYTNLRIELTVE